MTMIVIRIELWPGGSDERRAFAEVWKEVPQNGRDALTRNGMNLEDVRMGWELCREEEIRRAAKQELVTIAVENIGGDKDDGKYAYAISHQNGGNIAGKYERDPHKLLTPLDKDGKKTGVPVWKQGIVASFRRSRGAALLLHACLVQAFGRSAPRG